MNKRSKWLIIILITIVIVSSISFIILNLELPKSEIIAEGQITGEVINDGIIIWTEKQDNERFLYYRNISKRTTHRFAGPMYSGYTCDIDNNDIVWLEIQGRTADIHLYDIESDEDEIIAMNVNRTALALYPRISNSNVAWFAKESTVNGNEVSSLHIYNISNGKTDVLLNNVMNWRGLEIEDNMVVFIHDYYANVSVFNITDNSLYTLEEHNLTSISLSESNLVFERDDDIFLFDLKTRTYRQLTEQNDTRARPNIYNENIVWMQSPSENGLLSPAKWDVYLFNLSANSEKRITFTSVAEFGPQVYGRYIIWTESETGSFASKLILYEI